MNNGPTDRGEFDYRAITTLETYADWMKYNSRFVYGYKEAATSLIAPEDCRYNYNPETNRLYRHFFAWSFKAVHLTGLEGKVKYAQLLNYASEIFKRETAPDIHAGLNKKTR